MSKLLPYIVSDADSLYIESLIDKHGLGSVVQAIAAICEGKAEHLRENWQDEKSAVAWEKSAAIIEKAADKAVYHTGG